MFNRPEQSYEVPDQVIDAILSDPAHPLSCIAGLLKGEERVLDIGAGSGVLGRVLARAGLKVIIDGIEPNLFAANLARNHYRNVYVGLAQEFYDQISAGQYDFLILADVLEHIANPQDVLSDLLRHLPPRTKIIVSVPNVAFGGVRLALLNGNFDYVDSGLLERTHLRFFTKSSLEHFFSLLGLKTERAFSLERSFYRAEFNRSQLSSSAFTLLKLALRHDARAYQYLYLLNVVDDVNADMEPIKIEHKGVTWVTILIDYCFFGTKLDSFVRRISRKIEEFNA